MFCRVCGNEICDQAVICPKCGCAVVEEKQTKIKTKKSTINMERIFTILKYVSVALICLSIMFMVLAIFGSNVDVDEYLRLNYNKYTGYDLVGSIYASWWTAYELSIPCIIFACLAFVVSVTNFIISFFKGNREKRFSSDVIFIISILTMILSIACISVSW